MSLVSAHVTQQYAFLHFYLIVDSEPNSITVSYDQSPDEDTVDMVSISPPFSYDSTDNSVSFYVLVLTDDGVYVDIDGVEYFFDYTTETQSIDLEIGYDEIGWWVDTGYHLIHDKLKLAVFAPMGRKVGRDGSVEGDVWAGVDGAAPVDRRDGVFLYQLLVSPNSELGDTRVYFDGLPPYSAIETYLGSEPLFFSLEGAVVIELNADPDSSGNANSASGLAGGQLWGVYYGSG